MTRDAIRARVEAAHAKVSALCSGKERWTMSVPPEFDRDHDLVITAALADVERLLDVADAAEAVLATFASAPTRSTLWDALRAALDALDAAP